MSDQHHVHPGACGVACPLPASVPLAGGAADDVRLDRRLFLSRSMLAAAALALAACSAGGADATAPASVGATVRLADYPALATVGGVAVLTASGSPVALVRTAASTFVALSLVCPHEGTTVGTSSTGFLCPRHGARFDGTGTWIGGQRTSSLHGYGTSYDATTGTVQIA